ncbi:hypothetical protein pb186bvf_002673 [Paramecium bursaria]
MGQNPNRSQPRTESEANNILQEGDLSNTIGELMKSLEETSKHLESIDFS